MANKDKAKMDKEKQAEAVQLQITTEQIAKHGLTAHETTTRACVFYSNRVHNTVKHGQRRALPLP